MIQVQSLSLQTTWGHKFTFWRIAETVMENQFSNLSVWEKRTGGCVHCSWCACFWQSLWCVATGHLSRQHGQGVMAIPSLLRFFRRLACRGSFPRFSFPLGSTFLIDATPHSMEDLVYECGRPHDTFLGGQPDALKARVVASPAGRAWDVHIVLFFSFRWLSVVPTNYQTPSRPPRRKRSILMPETIFSSVFLAITLPKVLHTVPCFEDSAVLHTFYCEIWLVVIFLSISWRFSRSIGMFHDHQEWVIVRDDNKKLCYIALDYDLELSDEDMCFCSAPKVSVARLFVLPANFIDLKACGAQDIAFRNIMKGDVDIRVNSYISVSLPSGTTMFQEISEWMTVKPTKLSIHD